MSRPALPLQAFDVMEKSVKTGASAAITTLPVLPAGSEKNWLYLIKRLFYDA